ncbi:signal peptidase I [Clostridium beijerinckii]|uniref:Signal peptidase I n=1 Tax=Clostridium beijerinckii TaxID=1520 RepID=A0AAE5H0S2_CLOBE|nr:MULTISPECIES: signal peptidase I [Clostridium]NSB12397.1 signal peptidase I [Clostridium beijerinckii]OOM31177.1 signal peptidase IB [Clostridium beijerinckii]
MNENDYVMESKDIDLNCSDNITNRSDNDFLKKKLDKKKNKELLSNKNIIGSFSFESTFFREWIIPIIAAIGMAFLINKFLIYTVYIPSESMVPTLNIGDKLIVTRIYDTSRINRGDIAVFYSKELDEVLIKRVIGLPGDHIEIHGGTVTVNGSDIKEDYVKNNENFDGVFDVPENKFFFLGDNRSRSNDARRWINPYIDASNIQGRAVLKFYPFKDFGSLN